ncbi:MAG: DUF3151 family protein [Microthrixaceae bacterium]
MTNSPVNLHTDGVPQTRLQAVPTEQSTQLDEALAEPESRRRAAVVAVLTRWPDYLEAWARLGDLGRDPIERYAAYRVGYHRGLDQLRARGWRGSGYVRYEHATNRGFLDALAGLRGQAAAIGETDEADRCAEFLHQLDPARFGTP